ncbi:unnamed protein product [Lathyrus oleraceus]
MLKKYKSTISEGLHAIIGSHSPISTSKGALVNVQNKCPILRFSLFKLLTCHSWLSFAYFLSFVKEISRTEVQVLPFISS